MRSFARLLWASVLVLLLAALPSRAADPPGTKDKEDDRSSDPGNHVVVELIEARTRLENDGTGESRLHLRFQVKSAQGREWLSQVYFSYRPEFEGLRYEGMRTLHPDGKVDEVSTADVIERDAPQQVPGIVHDVRVLGFAPRSLAVDDSLEFTVVRTSRKPIKPGDFWAVHDRLYSFPVRREVVTLDLPAERAVAFWSDPTHPCATTEDGGRRVRQWELTRESYRPKERGEGEEQPPPLYRVSSLADWSQVAAWYRVLQGERAHPTEEIRALALRLTESIDSPRGKAEALFTYVANEVRYLGMELGLGIIQPHSAADVLRNGYGDCKDKHTLLAALMESVGFAAVPVLVSSQRDVAPEEPPVPFSFDHVISELRLPEGPLWVDATMPFVPAGVLSPKLTGKKALHLEGTGGSWVDLPWRQQVPAFMRTATTGRLAASGDLTLESSLEARGLEEIAFRTLLSMKENDAGAETLAKVVALSWNGIEAKVSEAVAPTDLTVPFRLTWKGEGRFIPTAQKRTERILIGLGPGLGFLPDLGETEDDEAKSEVKEEGRSVSKPWALGGPLERIHSIRLQLDPAWTVELPLPLELTTSFATYRSTYTWSDHVLEISRKLVIHEGSLPAAKKAELTRLRKLVSRDFDQSVVFKRQGDFDVAADAAGMDLAALVKAGEASAENEDHESAATYFGQALEKDPDNKRALEGLGDAFLQMGRPDRAEEVYRRLLELSPEHEDAWNSLGLCLGTSKRAQEAEKSFLKQLEINPFHPRASLNLARLKQKQGKLEDALSWLEKAAAVDRENAYAQFLLGDVLLDLKREKQAREHLTRATELDASAGMRARVARRLTESGLDLEASRATAEAIVRQASSDLGKSSIDSVAPDYAEHLAALAESLNVLGTLAMRASRLADAESYYRAAHTVLPGEASARGLAEVLTRRDNKNEALEFWAYYRRLTGTGKPMPAGLAEYARACFGDQVEEKFDLLGRYLGSDHELKPPGGALQGPPAVSGVSSGVRLRALVDASGKVTAVRVLQGEEPFKSAAEKDVRRLPWTPLKWPGKAVDTVREVFVFYLEDGSGGGWWFYPVQEVGGQIVRMGLVPEAPPRSQP